MRTILLLLILSSMLLYTSCDKSNNSLVLKASDRTNVLNFVMIQKSNYLLLVPSSYQLTNKVYMLRGSFVPQGLQSIVANSLVDFGNRLVLNLTNGTTKTFGIQNGSEYEGHSIITVSDAANQSLFYTNGMPKADPDVSSISCKCIPAGVSADCTNGGSGSSDCSVESKYQVVGGNHVGSKCSVNCASGYYSCCNK